MGRTVFDSSGTILKRCSGCEQVREVVGPFDTPINWTEVGMNQLHDEHGVAGHKHALLLFCEDCTPHFDIAMLTLKDSLKPEMEVEI